MLVLSSAGWPRFSSHLTGLDWSIAIVEGSTLYLYGNGGSTANASHFCEVLRDVHAPCPETGQSARYAHRILGAERTRRCKQLRTHLEKYYRLTSAVNVHGITKLAANADVADTPKPTCRQEFVYLRKQRLIGI